MNAPTGGDRVEGRRLAERIAESVTRCPAVASLAGGPLATHLPGFVPGVSVHDSEVDVAVVARYGPSMAEVAAQVRDAVEELAPGKRVNVRIQDISLPEQGAAAGESERTSSEQGPAPPGAGTASSEHVGDPFKRGATSTEHATESPRGEAPPESGTPPPERGTAAPGRPGGDDPSPAQPGDDPVPG